jgi:apolipoprotein N-acyltransferase
VILNWILAFASAALLVLLFPRFSFVWLAPVALTPLLIACARETRWQWRFALGYAAGIAYWFGCCDWIQWTLAHHAGVSPAVAWFLFALFCLAKAVQMGVFAALAGPLMRSIFALPAVGALWVAIEWTHSYTGFEWLNLGNAGSDMSIPLRLCARRDGGFCGCSWSRRFSFCRKSRGPNVATYRRFWCSRTLTTRRSGRRNL